MAQKRIARISKEECVACGCCVQVCPKSAIKVCKGICAEVDPSLCIGCGKCEKICPATVVEMEVV